MTTDTTKGIITNNDFVTVTDATPQAGIISWWELSGTVNSLALRDAWKAAGLDPALVPEDPAPKAALKRAVDTLAEKRKLVRPFQGGYSLVEESEDGERLAYQQSVTATLDSVGQLKVEPATGTLAEAIRTSYQLHLEQLVPTDISGMLVSLCESLLAVGLRSRGGFYFLPPDSVGKFRAAVCALRSVSSHMVYELPALKTESAVAAILAAVDREASAEIEEFESILTNAEAGPRALKTKARQCAGVADKVAAYEKLLGLSLAELQARLTGMRSRLTEASLLAAEAESAK